MKKKNAEQKILKKLAIQSIVEEAAAIFIIKA